MNTEQIRLRVAIALTDALEAAECLRKTHVQDGDTPKATAFEAMMAQTGRTVGQQWQKLYEIASRERDELEAQIEALSALDGTDYYLLRWLENAAQMEKDFPPERVEGFGSHDLAEHFRLERLMHLGYAAPCSARERSFIVTQKGSEAYRLQVEEFQKRGGVK